MKHFAYRIGTNSRSHKLLLLFSLGLLVALASAGNAPAFVSPPAVGLGTAGSFAVLAHTGVTDTPGTPSTINGNLGNDANIATTGNPTINGTSYIDDGGGVAAGARAALSTAIGDASGRSPNAVIPAGVLAGVVLPGVYTLPSATTTNLPGNVTFSGGANSVWIFQAVSDLKTAVGSSVTFIGGARACNVFWVVPSTATINGASFAGTVMASDSVTFGGGVTLNGRALAYTGDVTLIGDTISRQSCAAAGPTPTPTPTPPPPAAPDRALYCDPSGKTYNLVVGQDKLPPYAALGLVPAYVDPVTGSESCNFPVVAAPTPTPLPVVPPVPVVPAPTQKPPAKPKKAKPTHGVKGATKVRVLRRAPKPKPARHHSGFTG